jgi:hypothetical protein
MRCGEHVRPIWAGHVRWGRSAANTKNAKDSRWLATNAKSALARYGSQRM